MISGGRSTAAAAGVFASAMRTPEGMPPKLPPVGPRNVAFSIITG